MSKFPKFRDEFCPFTKEPCRSDCQFYTEQERQSEEVENTFSECWLSTAALNLARFADVFEHLILLSRQSDRASLRTVGHEEAEDEERQRSEHLGVFAERQRAKHGGAA